MSLFGPPGTSPTYPNPTPESMNTHLQRICKSYSSGKYTATKISWNDNSRAEGSCWGSNITDARLTGRDGENFLVVRPRNFNERIGKVRASDLAVIVGNGNLSPPPGNTGGESHLNPITLQQLLKNPSEYMRYVMGPEAEVGNWHLESGSLCKKSNDPNPEHLVEEGDASNASNNNASSTNRAIPLTSLFGVPLPAHSAAGGPQSSVPQLADNLDSEYIGIRFQVVFLPGACKEVVPETYNYQTRSEEDPKNLILLCTSQGTFFQQDKKGYVKQWLHKRGKSTNENAWMGAPSLAIPSVNSKSHHGVNSKEWKRTYLEVQTTRHKVSMEQHDTAAEREEMLRQGKAVSTVIGTQSMGQGFNRLMTVQIPLKQKKREMGRGVFGSGAFGGGVTGGGVFGSSGGVFGSSGGKGGFSGGKGGGGVTGSVFGASAACASAACASAADVLAKPLSSSSFGNTSTNKSDKRVAGFESMGPMGSMGAKAGGFSSSKFWRGTEQMRERRERSRERENSRLEARAGRVSYGTDAGPMEYLRIGRKGANRIERNNSCAITVTVQFYFVIPDLAVGGSGGEGNAGVIKEEDIKAAIDLCEKAYSGCIWDGNLMGKNNGETDFLKDGSTLFSGSGVPATTVFPSGVPATTAFPTTTSPTTTGFPTTTAPTTTVLFPTTTPPTTTVLFPITTPPTTTVLFPAPNNNNQTQALQPQQQPQQPKFQPCFCPTFPEMYKSYVNSLSFTIDSFLELHDKLGMVRLTEISTGIHKAVEEEIAKANLAGSSLENMNNAKAMALRAAAQQPVLAFDLATSLVSSSTTPTSRKAQLLETFAIFHVCNSFWVQLYGEPHQASLYNMACCLSLAGECNASFVWLGQAFAAPGVGNAAGNNGAPLITIDHIIKDPDLELLRIEEPQRWEKLLSVGMRFGQLGLL